MSEAAEVVFAVRLSRAQISDLVFQQLEDSGAEVDVMHARHAITYAIMALDELGLIVRG